jgi:hypothetical protein
MAEENIGDEDCLAHGNDETITEVSSPRQDEFPNGKSPRQGVVAGRPGRAAVRPYRGQSSANCLKEKKVWQWTAFDYSESPQVETVYET